MFKAYIRCRHRQHVMSEESVPLGTNAYTNSTHSIGVDTCKCKHACIKAYLVKTYKQADSFSLLLSLSLSLICFLLFVGPFSVELCWIAILSRVSLLIRVFSE